MHWPMRGNSFPRAFMEADREQVLQLAEEAPFAPLRYLKLFGHDVVGVQRRESVGATISGSGIHLVFESDGAIQGQASVVRVEDLADHFDVPFYELTHVVTRHNPSLPRRVTVATLLRALSERLAGEDPAIITVRLEADDFDGLSGAEEAGFRIRETTTTFVNDLERRDRNPRTELGDSVTMHSFAADGPLEPAMLESILGQRVSLSQDHYHADPRLADDRCDALYERQLDRVLQGVGSDVLVKGFVDENLVGLGTWKHWDHLEPYGVSIAGSSFGFRMPGAPPGYLNAVAAFVCSESLTGNRLLEWSTQATNYAMVNGLMRTPSIRLCRVSHVLHHWTARTWD